MIENFKNLKETYQNFLLQLMEKFSTKDLLDFEINESKWTVKDGNIITFDEDSEPDDEFDMGEKYEDDEYVVVRCDYQQGIEDVYIIFYKSNKI
jgi:hypothetical protein